MNPTPETIRLQLRPNYSKFANWFQIVLTSIGIDSIGLGINSSWFQKSNNNKFLKIGKIFNNFGHILLLLFVDSFLL